MGNSITFQTEPVDPPCTTPSRRTTIQLRLLFQDFPKKRKSPPTHGHSQQCSQATRVSGVPKKFHPFLKSKSTSENSRKLKTLKQLNFCEQDWGQQWLLSCWLVLLDCWLLWLFSYLSIWIDSKLVCMDSSMQYQSSQVSIICRIQYEQISICKICRLEGQVGSCLLQRPLICFPFPGLPNVSKLQQV